MKTPNTLYSRLALITSVTLITGYFIVSAVWVPMDKVGTGDQLSATIWNTFVDNLNDLDARLKSTASTWPTVTGGIAYTGGNVGIGTITPSYKLHVTGATDILDIQGSTNAFYRATNKIGAAVATADFSFGVDDNTGAGSNAFIIYDRINSAYRFILNNSGNVGIGTTSPTKRLDVNGAIAIHSVGTTSLIGRIQMEDNLFQIVTPTGKVWEFRDTGALWFWNGTVWVQKF